MKPGVAALLALGLGLSLWAFPAQADCFDFKTPKISPPRAPLARLTPADASQSGKTGDVYWAEVAGVVQRPIQKVFLALQDPYTLKDRNQAQVKSVSEKREGLFDFKRLEVTIKPFLFVSVSWTEEWAFQILEGTPEAPKKTLFAYQKTEGTSHLKKLCGMVLLTWIDDASTDAWIYEEADTTGRNEEKTLKGNQGTLATLRAIPE